jgi:hypothetical protein
MDSQKGLRKQAKPSGLVKSVWIRGVKRSNTMVGGKEGTELENMERKREKALFGK